jgi:hypothetical protein
LFTRAGLAETVRYRGHGHGILPEKVERTAKKPLGSRQPLG